MCSKIWLNARNSGRFVRLLHISRNYTLQTLCGVPHKVCNEEGKLEQLPLNRALRTGEGEIYDITAGNMLIVGLGTDNVASLTPEQLKHYEALFHQPETFFRLGGHLLAFPIPDKAVRIGEKAQKPEIKKDSHDHNER